MMALVAVLVLHPVLAVDMPLRMAASDAAGQVEWQLDGFPVGTTGPGQALQVQATAGTHWVSATSNATMPWTAMVRPDPPSAGGAAWTPAWTASSPGVQAVAPAVPTHSGSGWVAGLLALCAGVLLSLRRRRRPARDPPE